MYSDDTGFIESVLDGWAESQRKAPSLFWFACPRCGRQRLYERLEENAISRRYDIAICSECAEFEAFEDIGLLSRTELDEWFAVKNELINQQKLKHCNGALWQQK